MLNQPRTNRAENLTDCNNSPTNTGEASNAPVANGAAVAEIHPIWNNEAIKERFDALTHLEHGWDGYDGIPVKRETAEFARRILQRICPEALPTPAIIPGGDGSVQLEWHTGDYDIEINILTPPQIEACRSSVETGAEDEVMLSDDVGVLCQWMIELGVSIKNTNNGA